MTRKLWALFFAILVLFLGGGYLLVRTLPTLFPGGQAEPLPAITVEAYYPGAGAQVVADTVAAPIEQQVNGVEGMVSMRSQSTGDGRYTLNVSFQRDVDLNMAHVLVQNRVTLADPALPDLVKRHGVSVKKKSPRALLFVILSSPDGKYDSLYLSNYARIQIKDELARLGGVAEIALVGQHDDNLRMWLDPQKMAARNLTAADVTMALKEQNLEVEAGPVGESLQLTLHTLGRLTDVEQLQDVVVKADTEGRPVRLKEVANIERGVNTRRSEARLNGKPVVVMALYPIPQANTRELSAAVQDKLAQLRARLPDGLDLQAAFEIAPNRAEYLRVDLALPDAASAERTLNVVEHCTALVRNTPGVQDELSLCGPPFALADNHACILVRLAAANERDASREQVMERLRSTLEKGVPVAVVRLCDVSQSPRFPLGGYPIDLAICDREDQGMEKMTQLAQKLAERLRQSGKLTDVGISPGAAPVPQLQLDIDRTAAKKMGVSMQDVFNTLQVFLGSFYVNDFNRFGRTWRVNVQAKADVRLQIDDIMNLKVRNAQGKMVPLGSLVSVRQVDGPAVIERLNMWPIVGITANPAAGVPLAEARALCESLADEVRKELGLAVEHRWTDLD